MPACWCQHAPCGSRPRMRSCAFQGPMRPGKTPRKHPAIFVTAAVASGLRSVHRRSILFCTLARTLGLNSRMAARRPNKGTSMTACVNHTQMRHARAERSQRMQQRCMLHAVRWNAPATTGIANAARTAWLALAHCLATYPPSTSSLSRPAKCKQLHGQAAPKATAKRTYANASVSPRVHSSISRLPT